MAFDLYKKVRASSVCAGKPSAFQILQELAWYTHDEREYAWPTIETLARGTRQSVSTVKRAVAYLYSSGLINVEVIRTNGGKKAKNRYRINADKLNADQNDPNHEIKTKWH